MTPLAAMYVAPMVALAPKKFRRQKNSYATLRLADISGVVAGVKKISAD
jgi:hypothetical protein